MTSPTDGAGNDDAATRFARVDAIVDAALDLAALDREAFVARVTDGDEALRVDVERLLHAHANAPDAFLAEPGAAIAAPFLGLPSLRDGVMIGRHRLVRPLGEGGMGVVWLARDEVLERDVALKIVRGAFHVGDADRDRAGREARAVARLDHPHVAGILDVGETTGGALWFSMPYCAGGSLADRLRAGRLPVADVLRIGRQLASALAAAHAQQVVHRDVKPANVLFDAADNVRLADFGVAKLADVDATRGTGLVGTVAYLAPEQVAEEGADHRADLWALGVTLHEMLVGSRPFEGPGYAAILHAIVSREPATVPESLHVPPALAALIARLLAKRPDDRPASAALVERELAAIAEGRATRTRHSTPRRTSRRALMTLGSIAAVVGVALVFWPRSVPAESQRQRAPTPRGSSAPVALGTTNLEAQEAFRQARYERLKLTPVSLARAVSQYERAVSLDPAFARAWAGLANALVLQGVFGNTPMTSVLPRARATAQRALDTDSTIAEAHAALAHVQRVYDFDWDGSLRELVRAAALDADEEVMALQRSITLLHQRRFAEAESVLTVAVRLDPANPPLVMTLGRLQLATARLPEAEATLERAVAMQPGFSFNVEQLGYAQLARGNVDAARASLRRAALLSGSRDSAHLAHVLAVTGAREEARRILAALDTSDASRYLQPVPMAAGYAGLGDADRAFEWLERSWRERASTLDAIAIMPALASLHRDARWAPLLRRLGLPVERPLTAP